MNIFIGILKFLLAVWHIMGGAYMTTHYEFLINEWAASTLPSSFWMTFGVVEVALALGLLLSMTKKFRKWTTLSALGLAIMDLSGILFFIAYTDFSGMLWAIVPALILGFIGCWKK